MKYLFQFGIIIAVTFVGELMNYFIPLPIPASIWGLMIMLLLLIFKIVKLEAVKEASSFLIKIMPILFVPALVGLLTTWNRLQGILLPVIVITVVSLILVMAVSGVVTQVLLKRGNKDAQ